MDNRRRLDDATRWRTVGRLEGCRDSVSTETREVFSSEENPGVHIGPLILLKMCIMVKAVGWSGQASWQTGIPTFMCLTDVL
ncbi:hypothetical protein TNCV_5019281 [Trichonephila clavipes]|nr:hypothetical protein TNCV_5019281 [Trichonephila clavipes]